MQVRDVLPLRANQRARSGYTTTYDVPGCTDRWLLEMRFASIDSCEAEWHTLGVVVYFSGGGEVVVVDHLLLVDIELLLEQDAR